MFIVLPIPRATLLTAKTYVWVPSPGEQMINTYLSELMLGFKGILDHYSLTDKINIYQMLIWYSPFFPQRRILQNVLEIITLIEQKLEKGKEQTNCSKFQETFLLLRFCNALSYYLHPTLCSLLVDCHLYFKTQLSVSLCENTACSPDRANICIYLYYRTCI